MNLKEAFRFQNKIQHLMEDAENVLCRERNVTKTENTVLRHKVCPEAADETTVETPDSEYAEQINDVVMLLMYLLEQREKLGYAICAAKRSMDIDFDGEVSLNHKRQQLAGLFRHMGEIRCSETLYPNGGTGYKFNAEGNQVSYRCDLKKVTTINFDRNKVRAFTNGLNKKSDRISAELDKYMVNTEVAYEAPFDVNDTFAEVLQWHTEQNS
jgi:hypothetical protein